MALKIDTKFEENWLVLPKMTLESLKIGTFMGSFYPKQEMYEDKIYRGVIS